MSNQLNPFQGVKKEIASAAAESDQQRAIAEVQAAMVIAKKFPRDQIAAMDRILNACTRESLANTALYSYNKGGADITGPSIRLAEVLAQEWGNLQFGIRELSQVKGESTIEAFAWDIERNVRQVKTFQVKHERHTKSAVKVLTDPRDIYELTANQGARRLRACILGVIPGDVVEAATKQCEITMQQKTQVTPESIKAMVDAFGNFGVTAELIAKRLNKKIEAMNSAQMIQLRKIYASLKDGMSNPSDWFEVTQSAVTPDVLELHPLEDEINSQQDSASLEAAWKKVSKICLDAKNIAAHNQLKAAYTARLDYIQNLELNVVAE